MYSNSSSFLGGANSGRQGGPSFTPTYQNQGFQQSAAFAPQATGFQSNAFQSQPTGFVNANQPLSLQASQQNLSQSGGYGSLNQHTPQNLTPARTGQTSSQIAQSFQERISSQISVAKSSVAGVKIPKIRLSFLTAQDQAKFEQLFKSAVGDGQALSGDKVRDLLIRSKLPGNDLSQIWILSDTTKSGQLLFPEFALAMYLCNLRIVGKELPQILPEKIANEVSSMVDIISFGVPDDNPSRLSQSTGPNFGRAGMGADSLNIQQPQPQASNSQLLSQLTAQPTAFASQYIPPQATGLPQPKIQAQQGSFQQPQVGLQNPQAIGFSGPRPPMPPMPSSQNTNIFQPNGQVPTLPLNAQPTGRPGQWGLVNAPASGLPNIEALQQRMMPQQGREGGFTTAGLSGNATIPWAVTKEEKRLYDQVFKAWDGFNRGFIGGDTAIEVMGQSGLDKSELEKIWTLSDPGNKGKLDMDEFAVAMHLIYRKLNGYPIPNRLPPELVPPSTRNFADSIGTVKSLLSQDAETRKNTGAFLQPQKTGVSYLKNHSFRNEGTGPGTARKDATVFRNNDDDIGYKSSARRRVAAGGRTPSPAQPASPSSEVGDLSIDQLRKKVREKQVLLDAMDFKDENDAEEDDALDRRDRHEAEDLYRRIRRLQEDIDNHPTAVLHSTDSGAERRTLGRQLQNLTDRLPELASTVRRTERNIADAKLELFRLKDAKSNPTSAAAIIGTGPGGTVTESDRLKARAKAMMQQRSAVLTGKSSSGGDDFSSAARRLEDEDLKVKTERETNERMIKDVEDSVKTFSKSLEDSLKEAGSSSTSEHERRRWEDGLGVEDEVKDFIFDLQRSSRSARVRKEEPRSERASVSHEISRGKEPQRIDDQASMRNKGPNSSSTTHLAYKTAEDRATFIKQQAEQRMAERLAALGLKPPARAGDTNLHKQDQDAAEREQRRQQAEAEDAKRDKERQRRLAEERASPPPVTRTVPGKKPPPPPARGARNSQLIQQAESRRKAEEDAVRQKAEQEVRENALKEAQEVQEARTKELEDETRQQERELAKEREAAEVRLKELQQQYETGRLRKQEEKQRKQAAEKAAKEKEVRLAAHRAELEAAKEKERQLEKQLAELRDKEDSSDDDSPGDITPKDTTPVASQMLPARDFEAVTKPEPPSLNPTESRFTAYPQAHPPPSYGTETKNPFFKKLNQTSDSALASPAQNSPSITSPNSSEISTNPFHRLAQQQDSSNKTAPLTSQMTGGRLSRARPEEDEWSVIDSADGSSDDDEDERTPAAGSAKQLASILFGTMGPPRPLSAMDEKNSPASTKTDTGPASPPQQFHKALDVSSSIESSAIPAAPPPPPPMPQLLASGESGLPPPAPPPPPPIPGPSNIGVPAPQPPGNSEAGPKPAVGALLGEIQMGKGLKKVETRDRSGASTAGRVLD